MTEETEKNCVIIGPTRSGKTSLLGALQFATARIADQPGRALRILPASTDMADLIEFSNTPTGFRELPGTLDVKRYVFDYEIAQGTPDGLFRRTHRTRFSMMDAPGGAILGDQSTWGATNLDPATMEKARTEAIDQLRSAHYIILCVDSTDETSTAQFIRYLPRVLMQTGGRRIACERLVICLTKADKYVVDHAGITTQEEFRYEDPVKRARRVIGEAGLNTLKMYLDEKVEIRAGWASVYGFEPVTGRPNYDRETGGLLIDSSTEATPAEILERWLPYQVTDPFIFLTVGDPGSLARIPSLGSEIPGVAPPKVFDRLRPSMKRSRSWLESTGNWMRALYYYLK